MAIVDLGRMWRSAFHAAKVEVDWWQCQVEALREKTH